MEVKQEKLCCTICWKEFSLKQYLQIHMRTHKKDQMDQKLHCYLLTKELLSKVKSRAHMLTRTNERMVCHVCGRVLAHRQSLLQHIRRHHKPKPLITCPKCGLKFRENTINSALHKHMVLKHSGVPPHGCVICGKRYFSKSYLKYHMQTHIQKADKDEVHPCKTCSKTFHNLKLLRRHEQLHTRWRKFQCVICRQGFFSSTTLKRHMWTHLKGDRPHKCTEPGCEKSFITPFQLKMHTRMHKNDRPFSCKICSKRFTGQCKLKAHMKSHDEPILPCSKCTKKFKSIKALQMHDTTMHGEGKSPCEYCGVCFSNEMKLREHLKEHEAYICEQCGKGYVQCQQYKDHKCIPNGELTRYEKLTITRQMPKSCSHCGKLFYGKFKYIFHMRNHEGIKPYSCMKCFRKFIDRPSLSRHLSYIHTKSNSFRENFSLYMPEKEIDERKEEYGTECFKCSVCAKEFQAVEPLLLHMKTHQGKHSQQCSVCKTRFSKLDQLLTHARVNHKANICNICGKIFDTLVEMKDHQIIHTSDRDLICSLCNNGFSNIDVLMSHLRRNHLKKAKHLDDNVHSKPLKKNANSIKYTKAYKSMPADKTKKHEDNESQNQPYLTVNTSSTYESKPYINDHRPNMANMPNIDGFFTQHVSSSVMGTLNPTSQTTPKLTKSKAFQNPVNETSNLAHTNPCTTQTLTPVFSQPVTQNTTTLNTEKIVLYPLGISPDGMVTFVQLPNSPAPTSASAGYMPPTIVGSNNHPGIGGEHAAPTMPNSHGTSLDNVIPGINEATVVTPSFDATTGALKMTISFGAQQSLGQPPSQQQHQQEQQQMSPPGTQTIKIEPSNPDSQLSPLTYTNSPQSTQSRPITSEQLNTDSQENMLISDGLNLSLHFTDQAHSNSLSESSSDIEILTGRSNSKIQPNIVLSSTGMIDYNKGTHSGNKLPVSKQKEQRRNKEDKSDRARSHSPAQVDNELSIIYNTDQPCIIQTETHFNGPTQKQPYVGNISTAIAPAESHSDIGISTQRPHMMRLRSRNRNNAQRESNTENRSTVINKEYCSVNKQSVLPQKGQCRNRGRKSHIIGLNVCIHCGTSYTDNVSLEAHMEIHTGQNYSSCIICVSGFTSSYGLEQHLASHIIVPSLLFR